MEGPEIAGAIERIRENRDLGAAQLARSALELLASMAGDERIPDEGFGEAFSRVARELAQVRPSMVSLLNAVGAVATAWVKADGNADPAGGREAAASATRLWLREQEEAGGRIAGHAAGLLAGTAVTLSYSSTVLLALEEAWRRGNLKRVIVAESRPLYEGRRVASHLADLGIPVSLMTDAQVGLFLLEADVAIVGADAILANGSLVNKAGTLLLALAARHYRIPLYVAAESHKVAPEAMAPEALVLEEKEGEEVLPDPIPGVSARNVYFDLTPGRYVTGYITEEGLLGRNGITILARRAPGNALRPPEAAA